MKADRCDFHVTTESGESVGTFDRWPEARDAWRAFGFATHQLVKLRICGCLFRAHQGARGTTLTSREERVEADDFPAAGRRLSSFVFPFHVRTEEIRFDIADNRADSSEGLKYIACSIRKHTEQIATVTDKWQPLERTARRNETWSVLFENSGPIARLPYLQIRVSWGDHFEWRRLEACAKHRNRRQTLFIQPS